PDESEEWKHWVSQTALIMPFTDRSARVCGGLWIDRDEPFDEIQKALLEDLCDGYAHAFQIFAEDKKNVVRNLSLKSFLNPRGLKFRLALAAAFLVLFI